MGIRISGLVKASRRLKEALLQGVPPEDRPRHLAWVRQIRDQVLEICRDLPGGVEDLPGPSRNAFHLFQAVLDQGPSAFEGRGSPRREGSVSFRPSLPGLQAFQDSLLRAWARGRPLPRPVEEYRMLVRDGLAYLEKDMEEKGVRLSQFPERTGRTFLWLKWLGREGRIEAYLDAVEAFLPGLREATRILRPGEDAPLGVLFRPGRNIYQLKEEGGLLLWKLHCGFLQAGSRERELLFHVLRNRRRLSPETRQAYKTFLSSPRFHAVSREIEAALHGPGGGLAKGKAWDLDVLFDKINQEYFQGRLSKPVLAWGDRVSRRTLGSYDPARNRITLSPLLDDSSAPECAPAFILYHEMLHLAAPGEVRRGRLLSHTAEFRRLEGRFRGIEEARKWIARRMAKEFGARG